MKHYFLKDWNQSQFRGVENTIAKYLRSRSFETLHCGKGKNPFFGCSTFNQFDKHLGFAYTSTGICAGLWCCNTELYLDIDRKWKLCGFVLSTNSIVYAWFKNLNEERLIFPIN